MAVQPHYFILIGRGDPANALQMERSLRIWIPIHNITSSITFQIVVRRFIVGITTIVLAWHLQLTHCPLQIQKQPKNPDNWGRSGRGLVAARGRCIGVHEDWASHYDRWSIGEDMCFIVSRGCKSSMGTCKHESWGKAAADEQAQGDHRLEIWPWMSFSWWARLRTVFGCEFHKASYVAGSVIYGLVEIVATRLMQLWMPPLPL
jgi:hypothetical protein